MNVESDDTEKDCSDDDLENQKFKNNTRSKYPRKYFFDSLIQKNALKIPLTTVDSTSTVSKFIKKF